MKINLNLPKLIFCFFLLSSSQFVMSQSFINEAWSIKEGTPSLNFDYSKTLITNQGDVLVIGNTITSNEGVNVLLVKYDKEGTVLWSENFDGPSSGDDYGTSIRIDLNGDILVSAATFNTVNNSYDFFIFKLNDSGQVIWDFQYDAFQLDDIPSDIGDCGNGNVIITGTSVSPQTGYDFFTIMLSTNGQLLWTDRYDFMSGVDGAVSLTVNGPGEYVVIGGSQESSQDFEVAMMVYNDYGQRSNVFRYGGVNFYEATDMVNDASGNIYITGYADNGSGDYDYKTIKLDRFLNLIWSVMHDETGGKDVASGIVVDASQNVYVTGTVSTNGSAKEMRTLKYDVNGNIVWSQRSDLNKDNLFVSGKSICLGNAELGVLAEVVDPVNGEKQCLTTVYGTDGVVKWDRKFDFTKEEVPLQIGNYANTYTVTGLSGFSGTEYFVLNYASYRKPNLVVAGGSGLSDFIGNELIVDFTSKDIDITNIDDDKLGFGSLDKFISPAAMADIQSRLGEIVDLSACKVTRGFSGLKSYHTISRTRFGTEISIPHFWSTLVLNFPVGTNLTAVSSSLESSPYVNNTELNSVLTLNSTPNDGWYNQQHSLQSTLFPLGHINVEGAWDLATGQDYVKVGVVDAGVNKNHEDFQVNGVSRVVGGYNHGDGRASDYVNDIWDPTGHGTKVTGIIGANRDNSIGVAGIAGGGGGLGNGVSLYNLRGASVNDVEIITTTAAAECLLHGATDVNTLVSSYQGFVGYGLGLHAMNHSYGGITTGNPNNILEGALRFAFRNGVVNVAARGNTANNPNSYPQYPASFEDHLVITVGGTDYKGEYWPGAAIDHGVDVAAPAQQTHPGTGAALIYSTTGTGDNLQTNIYLPFGATSAAAPHATGVAALMLSYVNQTGCRSNLSVEDIEYILEATAKDVVASPASFGYDAYTGFGLLNAKAALEAIEMPRYRIKHVSSYTTKQNIMNSIDQETGWTNRFFDFDKGPFSHIPNGSHPSKWYKVSMLVQASLEPNEVVIDQWLRLSGTNLYPTKHGANHHIFNVRGVQSYNYIASGNEAIIEGYVYEVDLGNGTTVWFPEELNDDLPIELGFSLYTENTSATTYTYPCLSPLGVETVEAPTLDALLYPNPVSQNFTQLKYTLPSNAKVVIQIQDLSGRVVQTVLSENQRKGVNFVHIPLNSISSGVYLVHLIAGTHAETFKLIKTN